MIRSVLSGQPGYRTEILPDKWEYRRNEGMGYYFDDRESAAWLLGNRPEDIIRLMAAKYMGDNPEVPYVWRAWDRSGIRSSRQGGYELDFDVRFPGGEEGETAYALGELYCPEARKSAFLIACRGPVTLWLNREQVFVSAGALERSGQPARISVSLRQGYNRFLICCERTAIGFGCTLQNAMPQWEPCNYLQPFAEREGAAGFLFTAPRSFPLPDPDACWGSSEKDTGVNWLPGPKERLDGSGSFYAWTRCEAETGIRFSPAAEVVLTDGHRPDRDTALPGGLHSLLLYGTLSGLREALAGLAAQGRLLKPFPAHGTEEAYYLLGPCEKSDDPFSLTVPGRLFQDTAWRPDREEILLRPYAESALYGRWTYPLGVTLYGLLAAGRELNEPHLVRYVQSHVARVTKIHPYALWDTAHFGFAGVNQQLCWLDALDDCGSFGSLMLECDGGESEEVRAIAARIAAYMLSEQPRTENGAFCRRDQTVWADDMYMSIPFLCRYSALTGDPAGIGTCVEQLLLYRDLLFMPEKKLMAHMMCLRHGKNNGIPWSRGNGWVLFSLSELFLKLPEDHPERPALLSFFRDLTEGFLAVQGKDGLCHQVLDDDTTYPESSSTAMMICAVCRGLRLGLYPDKERARLLKAVRKAWTGLTGTAVDRRGNLFGVCQGSGFSFSRAYYRSLSWRFNDTHGIGIVMLAGTELLRTPGVVLD